MTQPTDPISERTAVDRTAEHAAELERVVRREAAYRARAVQESLEYRKTIKNQAREIKELQDRAAALDAYVHQLHLERESNRRELRQATADMESLVHHLRDSEDAEAAREETIEAMRQSLGWRLAAPLRALGRGRHPERKPLKEEIPGARFTYFLRTSPYRIYRQPTFTLEGWAFPEDGCKVTGVRVRIDGRPFVGTYGLEESDVIRHHGAQPNNPKPGLRISFETPPGRHALSLEALLEDRGWVSFLTTPLWADHDESGARLPTIPTHA